MIVYQPQLPVVNAQQKICRNGHSISGDNLALNRINGKVYEICRICRNAKSRAHQKRKYQKKGKG